MKINLFGRSRDDIPLLMRVMTLIGLAGAAVGAAYVTINLKENGVPEHAEEVEMPKEAITESLPVQQGSAKKAAKPKKKRRGSLLLTLIFILCFAGMIVSGIQIARIMLERKAAKDTYSALRQQVDDVQYHSQTASEPAAAEAVEPDTAAAEEAAAESEDTSAGETVAQPVRKHTYDFDRLHELNPDIVGWIFCEGTNIDYPVLQGEDNDTYLRHLYNGEYNSAGSIFMDYRNEAPATDRSLVVYGHYRQDGSMFQNLSFYKDADFYASHPTMMFYTPEGDYVIELICGTVESAEEEFVRFDLADDAAVRDYVDSHRSASTFESGVELQPGDRIISLCTCSYEFNNARYMLIGRLVPVYED